MTVQVPVEGPRYKSYVSPRSLATLVGCNPLTTYPAHWELMRWYLCWRKTPYSEVHAALLVPDRGEGYSHYPCPYESGHWHIGRGFNKADRKNRTQRAKHTFRRAVRHEIWAEYLEKEKNNAT